MLPFFQKNCCSPFLIHLMVFFPVCIFWRGMEKKIWRSLVCQGTFKFRKELKINVWTKTTLFCRRTITKASEHWKWRAVSIVFCRLPSFWRKVDISFLLFFLLEHHQWKKKHISTTPSVSMKSWTWPQKNTSDVRTVFEKKRKKRPFRKRTFTSIKF